MSQQTPADRPALPRVLSGIQPTSDSFHFGNYLGATRQWVDLQETHRPFFFIADMHALEPGPEPAKLRERTLVAAAQLIAMGIDPERSAIFVQSQIPEHAELAWVLQCLTGFGEARRMTQFKDKSAKGGEGAASVGLFTYPILQAADILLYRPAFVPVGEDQRQHLELTRDLAQRFNHRYKKTFRLPEPYILKETAKILDLQNPAIKMSKSNSSVGGIVEMLDDPRVSAKKIRSAVTDSGSEVRFDPEEKPGVSNLLTIFSALSGRGIEDLVASYDGQGYGALKGDLADVVVDFVTPFRDRTLQLLDDRAELQRILAAGAESALGAHHRSLRRRARPVGGGTPAVPHRRGRRDRSSHPDAHHVAAAPRGRRGRHARGGRPPGRGSQRYATLPGPPPWDGHLRAGLTRRLRGCRRGDQPV